jgi:steroid delta-isomerase-like uncharacterized protein
MADGPARRGVSAMHSQTEKTMRSYLDALLKRGDFAAHFSDDVLWTTMEDGGEVRGREAVRDVIVSMHQRFFDASPELRSLVCGDGVAAVEAVFVGRHVADFAGVPATGRQVRVPYTMFYELDGDAITELRGYLSMSALLSQLQEPAGRPAAGVS